MNIVSEDCVILFLHHIKDDVTNYHLDMLKKHNPHFKVIPLTPDTSPRSELWDYSNMWMYNDTMIYDWIDSKDFIRSKRYCWFDWDALCQESVDKYFDKVWDSELAGTTIHTEQSYFSWQWFQHARKNKTLYDQYKNKLLGISPFCGMIMSGDLLLDSISYMKKENELWKNQNNELRLATCASMVGGNPEVVQKTSIQPFPAQGKTRGNIIHPIKTRKINYMTKKQNFEKILPVSAAFSNTNEIIRDLNASIETYPGWSINYLGQGDPMKSYVDAKVVSVYNFLQINEGMYEWAIIIDSNDTIVLRPFNENHIISLLESFDKPIIFGGEANCYPLKELNGLYTSDSSIRYLNSGVVAIKKDFIKPLFEHVLYLHRNFPEYSKVGYNPPGDQTYYQLCLFSKEIGQHIAVDDKGIFSVSTAFVPDDKFTIINNELIFENKSRPYILHCQGNDKHDRKREFMRKLNIPVRG